ncbi:hypothetical protein TRFO_39055 [Tritrichomonas foetus]|uniref:Uncharacterized protein n=1 Tax=Tritrichomonas foetus TaxID=1144522 RepID=A0A1J4J942_9EUKA|nr:hypothetical protein TRFO_39055 [Tritrichomonas foetus]|eukprot:OHS94767.1 hypothetical protein TRFO_39055 [Tritrichomonas foetus]
MIGFFISLAISTTGIVYGNPDSSVVFEAFIDPSAPETPIFLTQVNDVIEQYGEIYKVVIHPTPTKEHKWSHVFTRLIYAVYRSDEKRGQFYLPWVLLNHQTPFLDGNDVTEEELLKSVLPGYSTPLQINTDELLRIYKESETNELALEAIKYAEEQEVTELPSISINYAMVPISAAKRSLSRMTKKTSSSGGSVTPKHLPGIVYGNEQSSIVFEVFIDPSAEETPLFFQQVNDVINQYGSLYKIVVHPTPTKVHRWSYIFTRFIYAVHRSDVKRGQFYLPWVLLNHQTPFLDGNDVTEEELLKSVLPGYSTPLQINTDELRRIYTEDETYAYVIEAVLYADMKGITELPSINVDGIEVPMNAVKSSVNRKTLRTSTSAKPSVRPPIPGIVYGNESSEITVDIFIDPAAEETKIFFAQISEAIEYYGSQCRIVIHPTPTREHRWSFLFTRLITAVKNTDYKRGQFYLPWVINYHQEPFLDSNNVTEKELLSSVLPTYQNPLQIYPNVLLNEYLKQSTIDETIDAILFAIDEEVDELPAIKINDFSIGLKNKNLKTLFKAFVKPQQTEQQSTNTKEAETTRQQSTVSSSRPVTYRGMKSMRGSDFKLIIWNIKYSIWK